MDADARSIKIHTEAEFDSMRRAGRLAAETLDYITDFVAPGVTTDKLDQLCAEFCLTTGRFLRRLIIAATRNQLLYFC